MKGILLCAAFVLAVIAQASCAPVDASNSSKPLETLSDDIARKAAELDKQFAMIDVNSDKMVEEIERRSQEIGDPSNLIETRGNDVDKLSDEMDDRIEQLGKNIEESVAGVRHTIPKETDQPSNKTTFDIANDAVEAQGDLVEKIGNKIEHSMRSTIPYSVLTPARRRKFYTSEDSGKTPFLAGRNTRGVIVPMNKKRMKKLIMFYYISKKYPTFVRHLLGKFDKELNSMPRLSVNETLARFIAVDNENNKHSADYNIENDDDDGAVNDDLSMENKKITPNTVGHRYDDGEPRGESQNSSDDDNKMDQIMAKLIETNLNVPSRKWHEISGEGTYKPREYYDRYDKNAYIDDDIDHNIEHERNYQHKVDRMISNIMNSGTGRRTLVKSELDELNMLLENNFFKKNKTKSSIFKHKPKNFIKQGHEKNKEKTIDDLEGNNDIGVNRFRMFSMKKREQEQGVSKKYENKNEEEYHHRIFHKKRVHRHRKKFDPYATIEDIPTTPAPTTSHSREAFQQEHSNFEKGSRESHLEHMNERQGEDTVNTAKHSRGKEEIHGDRRQQGHKEEMKDESSHHTAMSEQPAATTKQLISHSEAHDYPTDHLNSAERYFNNLANNERKDLPNQSKDHDKKMINLLEYILRQLPSTRSIHFYHRVKDLLPIMYRAHNVQDLDRYMKNDDQRETVKTLLKELPDAAAAERNRKNENNHKDGDDKRAGAESLEGLSADKSNRHNQHISVDAKEKNSRGHDDEYGRERGQIDSDDTRHVKEPSINENAEKNDLQQIPEKMYSTDLKANKDIATNKVEQQHFLTAIELQNCLEFEAANNLPGACNQNQSVVQQHVKVNLNPHESPMKEYVEPEVKFESSESKSMLLEDHLGAETNQLPQMDLQENGNTREISGLKPKKIDYTANNMIPNSNLLGYNQPLVTSMPGNILGEQTGEKDQTPDEAKPQQQNEINLPGESNEQLQNENILRKAQNPFGPPPSVQQHVLQTSETNPTSEILQQSPEQLYTSEVNPDKVQKEMELYSQLQAHNLGITEDMLGDSKNQNANVIPPDANIPTTPKLWENFNENILNDMNAHTEQNGVNKFNSQQDQKIMDPGVQQTVPQGPITIEPAALNNGDMNYAL